MNGHGALIAKTITLGKANAFNASDTITIAMAAPTLVARRMVALVRQLLSEGKTQRDLEREWGVSQSLISDWLSGKRNASNRTAEKVAKRMRLRASFFNEPRFGDAPDYHEFVGLSGDDAAVAIEPAEFLEWERTVAPFLRPALQAHERRQMVAIRFHRGALEKYSRLLQDLRDGVTPEEIVAEEAETEAALTEARALGVPARGHR